MATDQLSEPVDRDWLRACIDAQRCPWCDGDGFRSLASHTVRAHGVHGHELRDLAGLAPGTPLCSPELSERHRQLALGQDTGRWLHRPEVAAASAVTREANLSDEQRKRREEHLAAVRPEALLAFLRSLRTERADPALGAARKRARSKAHRALRAGAECPICGSCFCSLVVPGQDYRQRKLCSDGCRREAIRRARRRDAVRRRMNALAEARRSSVATSGRPTAMHARR